MTESSHTQKKCNVYADICSFVRRNSRITAGQRQRYQTILPQYLLQPEDIADWLASGQRAIVDVGFGNGISTGQLALTEPKTKIVAVETYRSGLASLASRLKENQIENVRLIEFDALPLFDRWIGEKSLHAIQILFPDPWPKLRHRKRRILQSTTLPLFLSRLTDGGCLYFCTDNPDYYRQVRQFVTTENSYFSGTQTLFTDAETAFEKKAKSAGRLIYNLSICRKNLQ